MEEVESSEGKSIPFAKKLRAIGRHIRRFKNRLILLSGLGIISAGIAGVTPLLLGRFFDALIHPGVSYIPRFGEVPLFVVFLALWILTGIIVNVVEWYIGRLNRELGTRLQAHFVVDAFSHLLKMPVSFFKDKKSGEVSDLVNRASWMLDSVVSGVIVALTPEFLSIAVGIAVAYWLNPLLANVLVVALVLYMATLVRIISPIAGLQHRAQKLWSEVYGNVYDAYMNMETVKQAGAEDYEHNRSYEGYFGKNGAARLWNRIELAWNDINAYQRLLIVLTQVVIFSLSISFIMRGEMTIGELVSFSAYASMIFGPFVTLGSQWQTFQNGLTAVAQAEEIFSATTERYDTPSHHSLGTLNGDIAFDSVRFSYGEDEPEVLKGLSFTISAGQVVALVGETGAGKSTTADLISGYYQPTEGRVLIDGTNMEDVGLRELRDQIAVVPQEVVLFNTTVMDNIRYGKLGASDEEVRQAAKMAHADLFIERFPKKYEQLVGERGIKLSVGQKQRIAIARAILRNPRILILDEPTSALDPETERYVTESLEVLMKDRTTVIIAHRLSTVRKADKILVLEDGKLVEEGNHDALMQKKCGKYRHLYELHAGLHE